jgi:hypothetical protein
MRCELECGHEAEHRVPVDEVTEADVTGLLVLWCRRCQRRRCVSRRRLEIELDR